MSNPSDSPDSADSSQRSEPPEPPGSLPAYVADGLRRQDRETLADVIAYAKELRAFQAAPVTAAELAGSEKADVEGANSEEADSGGPDEAGADESVEVVEASDRGYTEVVKRVTCGDSTCKCASGAPEDKHGPYRYHVRRAGGRLEWEYRGPVSEG